MPKFDKALIEAGIRGAASVLLANSLVIPVLTNGTNKNWWILFVAGATMLLYASIKKKEG